ncbi:MAG: tRNA/rRNA methyltransferase [Pasteurellaceae bacterium]|nr:tRNA/rRNA methyltransferase [Pasteurellaceae bacterium]
MNNSTKPTFQPPRFQTTDDKRFKSRHLTEHRSINRQTDEFTSRDERNFSARKSTLRDKHSTDSRQWQKNAAKKDRGFGQKKARTVEMEPQVKALELANTKGERVKVLVKSTGEAQHREKKTGPLSPRAPEKIKKNRAEEMKVYGENACLTLFKRRPDAIVRVWTTVAMAHKVGKMFSYLAANKKVYHVVDSQELELVSGTEHHGGICMLVKKSHAMTLSGYLAIARQRDCLFVLDAVRNAYNLGGILRTCAAFGVTGIVVEDAELLYSGASMRVAEGGAEYIHSLQVANIEQGLQQLRQAGYQIVFVSTHKQAQSLAKLHCAAKVAFVLSESECVELAQANDNIVNLSFANPLNTGLNVAVQAGVLLTKWQEAL